MSRIAIVHFVNYKRGTQSRAAMRGVMLYVMQEKKTAWEGAPLISGINCQPQSVYDDFLNTKLLYHKDGGVMFYHMVQSFPKGAEVDPRQAHEAARRLAEYFDGCEVLACTHVDREHMNQPSSAPPSAPLPQPIQPIVIQCDLPQTMNKLAKQVGEINWELEEIRKTLPELKTRIDLTPVQKSLTEMQRSLTEMNKLLERVGNLSEKYSCKWIRWLPDFSLLVALKWIALLLVIGAAAMAGWYGVVAIRSLFP